MTDLERVLYFAAALVAAFVVAFSVGRDAAPLVDPAPARSPHLEHHGPSPSR